jgi:hypothetical protein
VSELGGERVFEVGLKNGARQFITHPRDLPYRYRGEQVLERTVALGMGELIARLDLEYGLKL